MFLNKMENLLTYSLNLSIERIKNASFGTSGIDYIDLSRIFKGGGLGGLGQLLVLVWVFLSFLICWGLLVSLGGFV